MERPGRRSEAESEEERPKTRLRVSNLHFNVSKEELQVALAEWSDH